MKDELGWSDYWKRVRQYQNKLLKEGITQVELEGKKESLLYWYCVQHDGSVTVFKGVWPPLAKFVGKRRAPLVNKTERVRFCLGEDDILLEDLGWGTATAGTMTLKELKKLAKADVAVGNVFYASVKKGDTKDSWKKPTGPVRKHRRLSVLYRGVWYRFTKRGWTYSQPA